MPRQPIGDFGGAYPTADYIEARQIRGGTINGQIIELAENNSIIRTENFDSGTSGWAIDGDGTAEFNDVTIRGTVNAGAGSDVDWSYISNVSIDNADITNLSFSKITSGSSGATITLGSGGVLRTAASGERVEFTNSGASDIAFYDGSGVLQATIGAHPTNGILIQSQTNDSIRISSGEDIIMSAIGSGQTIDIQGDLFLTVGDFDMGGNMLTNVGEIRNSNGSAGSPAYTFLSDQNTGMFLSAADDGRLAAGGSSIAQFTTGRFGPGSDNAISSGGSGLRWTAVWAVNGTIQTSDMRYKTRLDGPIPGLDFINQLDPFRYVWKNSPDLSVHWGLSAQQVLSLIGEEGPVRDDDIKSLNYAELVPSLILAVQELSAKLDSYER